MDLCDHRRGGVVRIVVIVNVDRLKLPEDVLVVPIELNHAHRVVGCGDGGSAIRNTVNTTVAGGQDDVAAGRDRRRAPDASTGRWTTGGKWEGGVEGTIRKFDSE